MESNKNQIPPINQKDFKNNFIKKFLTGYSLLTILALIFIIGFSVGQVSWINSGYYQKGQLKNTDEIPDYLAKDVDFRQFWDIWKYVKNNYVNADISDSQLFYGALSGVVRSLEDPYSVFLNPEISNKFEQELSGSFEGIGAEIGLKEGRLTVIAPLPGTPAERAGLRSGDLIVTIDDFDTRGIALDYAVSIIRGEKGTEVILNIYSEGDDEPRDVSIIRDKIEIDSVKFSRTDSDTRTGDERSFSLAEGDIAYIELLYFNENTLGDWNKTVQDILAADPKGIVFDLRNNPGGFLSTAIEIAGEWINGKDVVLEQLRDGTRIAHNSGRSSRFEGIPTVVLVNGGSASGSEIVAGALQDYGVAAIVGEQTFGKGSVQDLKKFRDGSSVKLTIAEWLTPLGRNINKEGITPDIEVELTREDYDNDHDPQLDKALEILRASN
ncbi:S41 family peptidase [Candidatus Falkowbacteria bacterium]|nr:S41 family peptidase [Candidatus Falkowbacteria bacterium]